LINKIIPLNFAKKRLARTRIPFPNFFDLSLGCGKVFHNQAKRKGRKSYIFVACFIS